MKFILHITLSAFFLSMATNGYAQMDSLLKALEKTIEREQMPGLMVSIVTKDSILFSGGIGYSDLENKTKVTGATLFHLASITKMFTALGIQKLVSEKKLNLDDPLRSSAPEIPFQNKWEDTHPVRVIHLLEHTAGFDDVHLNNMINVSGKPYVGLEAVKFNQNSLVSRWKPGEMMSYSNPGYVVLGYLIEKLSGKPWNEYIRQNVFHPLGMHHSAIDLNGKDTDNYAIGYYLRDGAFERFPFYIPGGNGAGSALVSSADDMSQFLKHLLNDWKTDTTQWLPASYLQEMETVHSTLAAKNGLQTGYALGNDLFPNNKKVTFRAHNGKGEGFGSWIFYNREAGIGYAVSNNGGKILWPVSVLIEEFLTRHLEKPTPAEQKGSLERFLPMMGYYQFMNPRSELWEFHQRVFKGVTLSIAGNRLVVKKGNGQVDSLINTRGSLFREKNNIIPSYVLGKDENGQPFFQGNGSAFYSKTSYTPVLIQKLLIYGGLLAMLLSVLTGIVSIFLLLFKKLRWRTLPLTILPALAVISLFAAYRKLSVTDDIDKAAFSTLNYTTLYIFSGSLAFGVFSLASVWFLYSRWSAINSRWIKGFLTFNVIFLCYMTGLFFVHGWIGVRIWDL